jgi:hypothetical protein
LECLAIKVRAFDVTVSGIDFALESLKANCKKNKKKEQKNG